MNIREPAEVRSNPFAGQLELNLLFDLTLVIEVLVASKNPGKQPNGKNSLFCAQAIYLLDKAGHTFPRFGETNGLFKGDFDGKLNDAVEGKLTLTNAPVVALDRLQCDVALAYGIRNHSAQDDPGADGLRTMARGRTGNLSRFLCRNRARLLAQTLGCRRELLQATHRSEGVQCHGCRATHVQ